MMLLDEEKVEEFGGKTLVCVLYECCYIVKERRKVGWNQNSSGCAVDPLGLAFIWPSTYLLIRIHCEQLCTHLLSATMSRRDKYSTKSPLPSSLVVQLRR
jgi:hypothetical protein